MDTSIDIPGVVATFVNDSIAKSTKRMMIVVLVESKWIKEYIQRHIAINIGNFTMHVSSQWSYTRIKSTAVNVMIIAIGNLENPLRGINGDVFLLATQTASRMSFMNIVIPLLVHRESKFMYLNIKTGNIKELTEKTSLDDLDIVLT
jgi:hypothetical protein